MLGFTSQTCSSGEEDETDIAESRSSSFNSMVAESRASTDFFVDDENVSLLTILPARLAFTCAMARSTRRAAAFFGTLASGLTAFLVVLRMDFRTVFFFSFMLASFCFLPVFFLGALTVDALPRLISESLGRARCLRFEAARFRRSRASNLVGLRGGLRRKSGWIGM